MQIVDNKGLLKAIEQLNSKKNIDEHRLLDELSVVKQFFDPVYHVNKLLPRKKSLSETVNNLMDETIVDATYLLTDKLAVQPSGSFLKIYGNTFVKNMITQVVTKNTYKIKAIGLAIIKNIF